MKIRQTGSSGLISLAAVLCLGFNSAQCRSGPGGRLAVVAYVHGDSTELRQHPLSELTHICYSFAHLRGNRLSLGNHGDTATLRYLVSIKKDYPHLKILLSMGGWGGCSSCSDVFSSDSGRKEFARSALDLLSSFQLDGIDLDWEYPAIQGYPGHRFDPADKHHFTLLVRELRRMLGQRYEITFATGGFTNCLAHSIEWDSTMPMVDRVNVMTYDLVNGTSTITGHHTPLYSTSQEVESTDHAVRFLDSAGVPPEKIVIGAAFYARVWQNVDSVNHGLYRPGTFLRYLSYKDFDGYFTSESGFRRYWDSTAQAPFEYSAPKKQFATFDDKRSIALKTSYALSHRLGGIMFWVLNSDTGKGGLLGAIGDELGKSTDGHRETP